MKPKLHFDGPVWRPPYEATSQLLQVTAGCTWHRCKFCTLYENQKFRMSPLTEIESDLRIINKFQPYAHRIFLTGANPFALTANRLADIALLVRKYVSEGCPTIGCFSRITDIRSKTLDDLKLLHQLGYEYITIGVESGDDDTLTLAGKGYGSADIVEQCIKLEKAGIHYNFFYLAGLAGNGHGNRNALRSANVFNQLHPSCIIVLSLTLFPNSQLYQDALRGKYIVAKEHERFDEIIHLVKHLRCSTHIQGRTVSNPIPFTGFLPKDRAQILHELEVAKQNISEKQLKEYRNSIVSL